VRGSAIRVTHRFVDGSAIMHDFRHGGRLSLPEIRENFYFGVEIDPVL
jgi:hypothetical protein